MLEFTLYYCGALKGNKATKKDKHAIRKFLHPQLKTLWDERPLRRFKDTLLREKNDVARWGLFRPLSSFVFAPLVAENIHLVAEIEIEILRPEEPGILSGSGDLDNRVKTFIAALRMPRRKEELPDGASPGHDERPFFCLLEDDSLVTRISAKAAQLLLPDVPRNHVIVIARVEAKQLEVTIKTLGLT